MMNWYAIYTRPRWEKKVAGLLVKRNIENYCPLTRVVSQWHDRKKVIYRPLFSPYVFVRVTAPELWDIKKVDGVINPVYWLGKPAIIKDNEIQMIRDFLQKHDNVQLVKLPVSVNDRVKIIKGPFMEKEGTVIEVTANRVKLFLPSLGYSITAEVAKDDVEVYSDSTEISL